MSVDDVILIVRCRRYNCTKLDPPNPQIFFLLNIAVYAAALLAPQVGAASISHHPPIDDLASLAQRVLSWATRDVLPGPGWALLGWLIMVSVLGIEDWPFIHGGLFPYSGRQTASLKDRYG